MEEQKNNFFYRRDEFTRNGGSVLEDFYTNCRTAPETGSFFHLNLYLESQWDRYSGESVCQPESTAFIGLVLSGTQKRQGPEETYYLNPGDVIIDRVRGEPLKVSALAGIPLRRIGLEICRNRTFEALCCTIFPERISVVHCRHPERVESVMKELKNEICQNGGRNAEISTLIFRLLQELSSQQGENTMPVSLQKALVFLQKHGYRAVSREQLAQASGVSVRKLNDLFLKFFHNTPGRYMIDRRISYAKELLATRRFSVRETAELAGFSSVEFFIREFRKYTGVTPGKY